nr:DUF2510 domain-containing protein [Cellulomonas sp. APG4]
MPAGANGAGRPGAARRNPVSVGPTVTPPGWYPDPSGAPIERWWNGGAWDHATRQVPAQLPMVPGPCGAPIVPPPGPYGYAPPRNSAATAGMVLGIICMVVNSFLLVSVPALILSIVGLSRAGQLERSGFGAIGRTKAVWGLVLAILGTLGTAFFKLFLF